MTRRLASRCCWSIDSIASATAALAFRSKAFRLTTTTMSSQLIACANGSHSKPPPPLPSSSTTMGMVSEATAFCSRSDAWLGLGLG